MILNGNRDLNSVDNRQVSGDHAQRFYKNRHGSIMPVIKHTHLIGGIQTHVYKPTSQSSSSVAILFLLHGRHGSAGDELVDSVARTILEASIDQQQPKLWIVTLVKSIYSLASSVYQPCFRIIVTTVRDLSTQGPTVDGPARRLVTIIMRMSDPNHNFNRKELTCHPFFFVRMDMYSIQSSHITPSK